MARVRYLALLSEGPEVLANFYSRHFGMTRLGASVDGDVSLTDGYLKLALFKIRPDLGEPKNERGLHHIGIEVDNVETVKARFRRLSPRIVVLSERGDLHRGEYRLYDPECNPISLSLKSFGMSEEKRSPSRIQHIAFHALDPERLCSFYTGVFGFQELKSSRPGAEGRWVTDGFLNIAIQPFYSKAPGHDARFGLNHCGLVVNDAQAITQHLKGSPIGDQIRVRDPDGNRLDLSIQKEWPVGAA
jgi:catechol 2,3-dioxygenase-like lactoylglutathione lyase family enzyme